MQHVHEGHGVPAFTPSALGQHYIDKDSGLHYNSVGTLSPNDWKTSGGHEPTYTQVANTQYGGFVQDYTDLLLNEIESLSHQQIWDPKANEEVDFNDSSSKQVFTDTVLTENLREYSSRAIVNLEQGRRHHHVVHSKSTTQQKLTELGGIDDHGCDVHPFGRINDYLGHSYNLTCNEKWALIWSPGGELWRTKDPGNPELIGSNGLIQTTERWWSIRRTVVLNPSELIVDAVINDDYNSYLLTNQGRVIQVPYNNMPVPVDWSKSSIDPAVALDINKRVYNIYNGAAPGELFIFSASGEKILHTTDGLENWTLTEFDMSLFVWPHLRVEYLFVFNGVNYMVASETSSYYQRMKSVILKHNRDDGTFTVVHTLSEKLSGTISVTHWTSSDRTKVFFAHYKHIYESSDGDTWTEVSLTYEGDPISYPNYSTSRVIGGHVYNVDSSKVHRSIDGKHWVQIASLDSLPRLTGKSWYGLWPHRRGDGSVDDESVAVITYVAEQQYSRGSAVNTGLSTYVIEPDPEGVFGMKTTKTYQSHIDICVLIHQKPTNRVPEDLLKLPGWGRGGYGTDPSSDEPSIPGSGIPKTYDHLEHELTLDMYSLMYGIDMRLIRIGYYFLEPTVLDPTGESDDVPLALRPSSIYWINRITNPRKKLITGTHPVRYTWLNSFDSSSPGKSYIVGSVDEIRWETVIGYRDSLYHYGRADAVKLSLSTHLINQMTTCVVKAEPVGAYFNPPQKPLG